MKKAVVIVIAVIILAGAGWWVFGHHSNSPTNSSTDNMDMSAGQSADNSPAVSANSVTIQNFAFSPANITVKKGTTVTWTNQDSVDHTVTENDNQTGPNSANLAQGQSYSFTYNTVGTFKYHCSIHPNMLGTVTVTE